MPFSIKFSLEDIKDSLLYWYSKTKRKITFEYIVWKGINDSIDDVNALVSYCKSIPSKVNLIEYNPIGDENFKSADRAPNKLSRIQDRIKSRFSGGLVVDIQKPDLELRKKIVEKKKPFLIY